MPPPSREDLWRSGKDETVEVNQRALIDKILARYSGEHTIFRELLQNADDAGAQHVQVKFYTQEGWNNHENGVPSSLPDAKRAQMTRYVVCNDGIPFRPEDWNRLKKIAEGNPDEEKIGAFGVGFYSLWSVCDDPFVESGSKWMGFYWKDGKDQLLARSGDMPPDQTSHAERTQTGHPWTSFTMALREPAPLEAPLDFARFLVTSITFMRTIKRIDMIVDDTKVLEVRKDIKGMSAVSRSGLNTTSSMGMMKVNGVDATTMVITARVMKWLSATGLAPPPIPIPKILKPTGLFASFFGRSSAPTPEPQPTPSPTPPTVPTEVDVLAREIQIYQADVKVTISSQFGRELERATKKAPPARMPASLVFSREDETATTADGSAAETKRAAAVFAGLCPPLDSEKSAKVFIGQPTGQTTGIGGHLAARFIPTVERESIDLVDRHVAHWNKELLWIGGYLSRMIYELELESLLAEWKKTGVADTEARNQILARGLHALRFFSFRPTTPSAAVGAEMESAFFQCAKKGSTFPIISTAGILQIDKVRLPNERLQAFLPEAPVITAKTTSDAPRALDRLRERGLLHEMKFEDVVQQLNTRPLTETEMIACLSWWKDIATLGGYSPAIRAKLLDAVVLVTDSQKIIPLNAVKTFINPQSSSIAPDMPLPTDTIPHSVTKGLCGPQMTQIFGWHDLTLAHYVNFVSQPPMSGVAGANPETDIRASPIFAERVLLVLGRGWQSISAVQQQAIEAALKDVACIPTRAGFKKPGEAYFEKNLLFDDLPTLALPKTTVVKGGLEKMLLGIGVRRTVNLQLVFSRLIGGGEWSCADLMKYLVSVKDTLTSDELARLKQTAAFPLLQPVDYDGVQPKVIRKKPGDLYEPVDALRELGLPLLDWGDAKWRSGSEESKMLYSLGLRRYPPIDVLLGIASGSAPTNEKALAYLLANTSTHYPTFDPMAFSGVPFIPATTATGNMVLAKPGEVFTNEACAILGFAVARAPASYPENAAKLRLEPNPPMERLVSTFLHAPESDIDRARKIFEYLGTRIGVSPTSSIEPLKANSWIPVKTTNENAKVRLMRPDEVYFQGPNSTLPIFANAFTFVDFGSRANMFLHFCGVKSEPSHKDVARLLLREPQRMLRQAGSPSKYLDQLRLLAANMSSFDGALLTAMRDTPFVLASIIVEKEKGEGDVREWVLCRASETSIIDSPAPLQFFGKHVLAAPEEHLLENFYSKLGAKTLMSKMAIENIPTGIRPGMSSEAKELHKHILERLTIFLSQHALRKESSYTVDFLSKGDNFVVREASDIRIRYTYRDHKTTQQHREILYACAERNRWKAITLTVSLTTEPDWYDVANALVQIIIPNARIDDALVLESILNTPLMALRKRGYNVDRILNQQREERLRLEAEAETARKSTAETKAREAKEREASGPPVPTGHAPVPTGHAPSDGSGDPPPYVDQNSRPPTAPEPNAFWNNTQGSIMDMVRNRLGSKRPGSSSSSPTTDGADVRSSSGTRNHTGHSHTGGKSTKRPTSLDDIRNTVHKAVHASRSEDGARIENTKQAVKDVAESQGAYCDDSAEANLRLAWKPEPNVYQCRVWLPHDQAQFNPGQLEQSLQFSSEILLPLASVFQLSISTINVFWDREGPLIAFNRNGALFCNARYYAAWHGQSVTEGKKKDAYISWYFSLAHELAHNLESAHNASHEFYFSSIAEEYLVQFCGLLRPPA